MPTYIIITLITVVLSSVIFTVFSYKKNLFNMYLKTFSSMLFMVLGLVSLFAIIRNNYAEIAVNELIGGFLILLALILCLIGDIILGLPKLTELKKGSTLVIVGGASWFGLGHLVYCIALIVLFGFTPWALLIALPLSLFYTFGNKLFGKMNYKNLTIGIFFYSILESLSFALCLFPLIHSFSINKLLLTIGFTLFFFSDMVLMHNYFGEKKRINSILCHATYYPAQILIALSIFFIPMI